MPEKPDVSIVDCHVPTVWDPDYAFDDPSFHDDPIDSTMLAIRCNEAC